MKVFLLFMAIAILSPISVPAQDTTRTYRLNEVVVTATKSPVSLKDSPSPVDIIGPARLFDGGGSSVADALRSVAGVFVQEYGSTGAMKNLSVRGTSSQHVLVLLDGNRLNSFQNSLVDLSLLPLGNVERIEVVRGGSAALYGSDALGGVVNVITKHPGPLPRIRAEGSLGSYRFQRYSLEGESRLGAMGLVAGLSDERGRDDYPFSLNPAALPETTLRRDDADFHRRQLYCFGDVPFSGSSKISLSAQQVLSDRGAAGPVTGSSDVTSARQNDDDIAASASFSYRSSGALELALRTMFHYSLERYIDPNTAYPINSFYRNTYLTLNPQTQLLLGSSIHLILGGEYSEGGLSSNDFEAPIRRVQKALYLSSEGQFDFVGPLPERLSAFATLRYDHTSDVGGAFAPKIGLNVSLLKDGNVHLRSSFGENYRTPSFNDLYYRGFSNPALKAEHSTSFDAGASAEIPDGPHNHGLEVTYFRIETTDRILFDPTLFIPVNIGRASSAGLELSYRGSFFSDALRFSANYTMDDTRKKNSDYPGDPTYDRELRYIPRELFNFTLSFDYRSATVSLIHTFVGERFVDDRNSSSLPAYNVTGLSLSLKVPFPGWTARLRADINNLNGNPYEVFLHYPMPGRTFRFTLGVES